MLFLSKLEKRLAALEATTLRIPQQNDDAAFVLPTTARLDLLMVAEGQGPSMQACFDLLLASRYNGMLIRCSRCGLPSHFSVHNDTTKWLPIYACEHSFCNNKLVLVIPFLNQRSRHGIDSWLRVLWLISHEPNLKRVELWRHTGISDVTLQHMLKTLALLVVDNSTILNNY